MCAGSRCIGQRASGSGSIRQRASGSGSARERQQQHSLALAASHMGWPLQMLMKAGLLTAANCCSPRAKNRLRGPQILWRRDTEIDQHTQRS